jgi:hypothetical protein
MSDRRDLQEELNRINELYHEKDLELRKVGGSDMQRQQMRDMLNEKKSRLIAEMGDDLQKLNVGESMKIAGAAPSPFSGLKKKLLGAVPFAGAAYGLASGDPAMAAEQAMGDIPVIGQGLEAIAPSESGNPAEERAMLKQRAAKPVGPKYQAPEGLPEATPDETVFSKLKNLVSR